MQTFETGVAQAWHVETPSLQVSDTLQSSPSDFTPFQHLT